MVISGTTRDNIIFLEKFDIVRYTKVIYICSLENDLKQMPNNDQTIIGGNGDGLSGGQKSRINLARDIFRQSDIYILDDSLSSLDSIVQKFVLDILVTHQIQLLYGFDNIILMDEGQVTVQTNFSNNNIDNRNVVQTNIHDNINGIKFDGIDNNNQNSVS